VNLSPPFSITSDTSIEAALEPLKLCDGIGEGGPDVGSRCAVQPLRLDEPGASGRAPEGASEVPRGLGVVVELFRPAASLPATASPRSWVSFMITFGFASTR
jgi:hypothetical protein